MKRTLEYILLALIVVSCSESNDIFVLKGKFSARDSTRASLKIAFVVYIILMSFDMD